MIDEYPDLPQAACRVDMAAPNRDVAGWETDRIFFPRLSTGRPTTRPRVDVHAEAKKVCGGCPELVPCRDWILNYEATRNLPVWYWDANPGVWGGLDPEQRFKLTKDARGNVA